MSAQDAAPETAAPADPQPTGHVDEQKAAETPTPPGFVSKLAEYEELFKDRYTGKDEEYMKRVNTPLEPIIIHPWPPQRDFGGRDNHRGHGHWRGGGGGHRGGGGDRFDRRDGRGGGRRRW
ncbi:hypothetical protein M3Y99_01063800 [Aphelenchoides fujianensis]|nr:hypothetical protein M3Y99_01063800 [Aphelenchoides fujianensis]